jgi:hypothetical protein
VNLADEDAVPLQNHRPAVCPAFKETADAIGRPEHHKGICHRNLLGRVLYLTTKTNGAPRGDKSDAGRRQIVSVRTERNPAAVSEKSSMVFAMVHSKGNINRRSRDT